MIKIGLRLERRLYCSDHRHQSQCDHSRNRDHVQPSRIKLTFVFEMDAAHMCWPTILASRLLGIAIRGRTRFQKMCSPRYFSSCVAPRVVLYVTLASTDMPELLSVLFPCSSFHAMSPQFVSAWQLLWARSCWERVALVRGNLSRIRVS